MAPLPHLKYGPEGNKTNKKEQKKHVTKLSAVTVVLYML